MYLSIHHARWGMRRIQFGTDGSVVPWRRAAETGEGIRYVRSHPSCVAVGNHRNGTMVIDDDPAVPRWYLELGSQPTHRVGGMLVIEVEGDVLVRGARLERYTFIGFRDEIQIGTTTLQLGSDWSRHVPEDWSKLPPQSSMTELAAEWHAIAGRSTITDCNVPTCPRTWDALGSSENALAHSCGTCHRIVRYCREPVEIRGSIARGEPFVAHPAPTEDTAYAERLDVALRAIVAARQSQQWRIERSDYASNNHRAPDVEWVVDVWRNDGEWEFHEYRFNLEGAMLYVQSRDWNVVELPLVGLDGDTLSAWLHHAFATLPPLLRYDIPTGDF